MRKKLLSKCHFFLTPRTMVATWETSSLRSKIAGTNWEAVWNSGSGAIWISQQKATGMVRILSGCFLPSLVRCNQSGSGALGSHSGTPGFCFPFSLALILQNVLNFFRSNLWRVQSGPNRCLYTKMAICFFLNSGHIEYTRKVCGQGGHGQGPCH